MVDMEKEKDARERLDDILSRGVGNFIDPDDSFRQKVIAKARGEYSGDIIVKFGVDPTRPDIHLGHSVILRKLRQLQDLGCRIVFLIGDITAQIGDPTGKSKVRPELAQDSIVKNLNTYLDQIDRIVLVERDHETKKILHTKNFSWIKNSDWYVSVTDLMFEQNATASIHGLNSSGQKQTIVVDPNSFVGKAALYDHRFSMQINELGLKNSRNISLLNVLSIVRKISYAQLIERDMFQERIRADEPLFMHEMLYPVLQGIDSKVLSEIYGSCDLEIGGTDQTFNMLMGRKIMEMSEQKPQAILACSLLVGLDGKEKMSKSLDNYISITDTPAEMFGKVMAISDTLIVDYFTLCTFTPLDGIKEIQRRMSNEEINPRDAKMDIAQQIVEIYHGAAAALSARDAFIQTFQKREIPDDILEVKTKKGVLLSDIFIRHGIVPSKSEFRRLVDDGAIRENGEKKIDEYFFKIENTAIFKIGKHRFVKIIIT